MSFLDLFSRKTPPLKTLAEKAQSWKCSEHDLRDYLRKLGLSDAEIDEAFSPGTWRRIGEHALQRALDHFERVFGKADANWLRSHVTIAVINSTVINCRAVEAEPPFPIHLYAGFLFAMHKIARVVASELLREYDPLSDSIEEARALLGAIYSGAQLDAAWSIYSMQQTQRQTLLSAQIAMTVEDAAIAHEIGHVLFWARRERDIVDQIEKGLAANAKLGHGQRHAWAVEHFADLTAARLLPRPSLPSEFAGIHGLAILFLILTVIERTMRKEPMEDHPPAFERLAFVTGFAPEIIQNNAVNLCATVCGKIGA